MFFSLIWPLYWPLFYYLLDIMILYVIISHTNKLEYILMSEFSTKNTNEIIKAINSNKITDFQIYGDKINLIKFSFSGYKMLHKDVDVFSKMKFDHHGYPENMFKISTLINYLKENKNLDKFYKFMKVSEELCTSDFEFEISNKTRKIAKDIGASHFSISPDEKFAILWDLNHHADFKPRTVRFMKTQDRWTPAIGNEVFDSMSNIKFHEIAKFKDLVNEKKLKKHDKKRRVLRVSN